MDKPREINGEVEGTTDEVGEYVIKYNAMDTAGNAAEEVIRTVKVLDPKDDEDNDGFTNQEEIDAGTDFDDANDKPETREPSIILNGKNPLDWAKGKAFIEPGYEIVLDEHDTITTKEAVKIKGEVDVNTLGEYKITYEVTDRYGKTATAVRIVVVKEDANNNGIPDENETKFVVVFKGFNGVELSKQEILPGLDAEAPNAPVVKDYVFTGWDKEYTNVTTDLTVNAIYKEDKNNNGKPDENDAKYTVTYVDYNGEIIKTFENVLVDTPTPTIADPTREYYRFSGWTPKLATTVTKDATYSATYVSVKPVINSITNNPSTWTNKTVTVTVNATARILFRWWKNMAIKEYNYRIRKSKNLCSSKR